MVSKEGARYSLQLLGQRELDRMRTSDPEFMYGFDFIKIDDELSTPVFVSMAKKNWIIQAYSFLLDIARQWRAEHGIYNREGSYEKQGVK